MLMIYAFVRRVSIFNSGIHVTPYGHLIPNAVHSVLSIIIFIHIYIVFQSTCISERLRNVA